MGSLLVAQSLGNAIPFVVAEILRKAYLSTRYMPVCKHETGVEVLEQ